MKLFSRDYVALSTCVDLLHDPGPCSNDSQKGVKEGSGERKWLQGFKEQCEIYGKAGVASGSLDSLSCVQGLPEEAHAAVGAARQGVQPSGDCDLDMRGGAAGDDLQL